MVSTSSVSVSDGEPLPATGPAWEQARDLLATDLSPEMLSRPRVLLRVAAGAHLARRPHLRRALLRRRGGPWSTGWPTSPSASSSDFAYDPGFTTVTTPLEEVLAVPPGRVPGLRPPGHRLPPLAGPGRPLRERLPRDRPPPGEERLVGADASHAWPSVFVPGWGWLDVDPTNDQIVGSTYVTTAWGRDYSDVSPLKGIVFGGGDSHILKVSVDVTRSAVVAG